MRVLLPQGGRVCRGTRGGFPEQTQQGGLRGALGVGGGLEPARAPHGAPWGLCDAAGQPGSTIAVQGASTPSQTVTAQPGTLPRTTRPHPTPAWAAQTTHSQHLWHTGGGRSWTTGLWSAPGDPWGPELRTWGLAGPREGLWEGTPGWVRSGALSGRCTYPSASAHVCRVGLPSLPPGPNRLRPASGHTTAGGLATPA